MKSIEEIILCSRIKIKMLVKLLLLIVGARMNHANNIYRSIRCKHDFMFHDRVRNPFFPFAISITNVCVCVCVPSILIGEKVSKEREWEKVLIEPDNSWINQAI